MKNPVVFGLVLALATTASSVVFGTTAKTKLYAQNSQLQSDSQKSDSLKKKKTVLKKTAARTAAKPLTAAKPATLARTRPALNSRPAARAAIPAQANAKKSYATAPTSSTSAAAPTQDMSQQPPAIRSLPTMTTSAPVKSVAKKPSPWGFKYRSYNAMDLSTIEQDPSNGSRKDINGNPMLDNELRAWDRFNVSYNFNDNVSVSLMPQFYHTWFGDQSRPQKDNVPGYTQSYSAYMGDTVLYLIDSKIATLPGAITIDGVTSYVFPTSEASQKSGMFGATRTGFGIGKSIGFVDLHWTENLWYYFQQYQTASVDKSGLPIQNLEYYLWSFLDVTFNITKKLSINLEEGFMNAHQFADANTGRPDVYQDNIILDPEIDYAFNDHFSLGLGIWEMVDMRGQNSTYTPLSVANGSEGYFMTTLKF